MNKIIEVRFGSHLYGTNTPESDLDIKGIYLPTAREIVLNRVRRNISQSRSKQEFERNNKDDIDQEFFSLAEYLKLLAEGQTVALDLLFSDAEAIRFKGPEYHLFQHIYDNRLKLLSKNVLAFIGYSLKQAAKYGIKGSRVRSVKDTIEFLSTFPDQTLLKDLQGELEAYIARGDEFIKWTDIQGPRSVDVAPCLIRHFEVVNRKFQLTNNVKYVKSVLAKIFSEYGHRALQAEKNEGIDWKALSHAVRVNFEGQELLSTGSITFPRPERQLLLDIKLGKVEYNRVADLIESSLKELENLQKTSSLQASPDRVWLDDFLYEVYSGIVKNG